MAWVRKGVSMSATPHGGRRAMSVSEMLGWVFIAAAPGLLHPLLGFAGAVLSAWRLMLFLCFSPGWSGGTVVVHGGSPQWDSARK